jgi:ADP-heptose:LPS heptosyltransferase
MNSNPFVRRLGARLAIGLRADGAPPLDVDVPYEYFRHEVLRALEVAAAAGAPPVTLEPRLAVTADDRAAALAALPVDPRPLAVLHPGAGDARRRWPASSFAAAGRALAGAGALVAVSGTEAETPLAREVCDGVPDALDLCGRLGMEALVGTLARAAVVVANDSGPLHLASAVGAPTVGVYWCGNLVNAGPLTASTHRAHASWRLACPRCGADCMVQGCDHDDSFVAYVPVEAVTADALELLDRSQDTSSARLTGTAAG